MLKRGKNLIAVKVVDTGSRGGFHGQPDDMFLQAGAKKLALDGPWKYDVEKDFGAAAASPFENTSLAETFFINYRDHAQQSDVSVKGEEPAASGKQVIKIKALVNEMKFDLKTFTVEAGKRVEVVFENPDFMQHNFVIVKPGALETVGRAADKLATDANGAELNYVPRIPEVLFHTALVNPEQSVTLEFIAPEQPGDYPFVCTFPGHWSIMNGVMKVFKDQSAL